jgi:hypothetical protein
MMGGRCGPGDTPASLQSGFADLVTTNAVVRRVPVPSSAAKSVYTLVALLCSVWVSGCGLAATHEARDPLGSRSLIGRNITDLEVCAGSHDRVLKLTDDRLLFEWRTADTTKPALSLTTPVGSLELGTAGACRMTTDVMRDGTVADVDFPGATGSFWEGPYASCAALAQECLLHRGATSLPRGYDAFAVFLPAANKP